MDTREDVKAATTQALDAVHQITDGLLEPEIGRATLLATAAVMIARNLGDGAEPGADEVNQLWKEQGFPWRMVRLSS